MTFLQKPPCTTVSDRPRAGSLIFWRVMEWKTFVGKDTMISYNKKNFKFRSFDSEHLFIKIKLKISQLILSLLPPLDLVLMCSKDFSGFLCMNHFPRSIINSTSKLLRPNDFSVAPHLMNAVTARTWRQLRVCHWLLESLHRAHKRLVGWLVFCQFGVVFLVFVCRRCLVSF